MRLPCVRELDPRHFAHQTAPERLQVFNLVTAEPEARVRVHTRSLIIHPFIIDPPETVRVTRVELVAGSRLVSVSVSARRARGGADWRK